MYGYIHSFQSLGAADGPGIRFVVFMQGCNLRCGYCHNPDTWSCNSGTEYTPEEVLEKVVRYKEYFGNLGGVTVSGGEPLLQTEFVTELFRLCKNEGINTCLDTSGSVVLNDKIRQLLTFTDLILLDIKFTDDKSYRKYVGCGIQRPLTLLSYFNQRSIPVWIRQVIVPTLNDTQENILRLKEVAQRNPLCVKKIELLPFRKICKAKYDNMGIKFPFEKYDTPSKETMEKLNRILLD